MAFEYYKLDIIPKDNTTTSFRFETEQKAFQVKDEILKAHKDLEISWNIYLVKKIACGMQEKT
jgi:hypothetical protein